MQFCLRGRFRGFCNFFFRAKYFFISLDISSGELAVPCGTLWVLAGAGHYGYLLDILSGNKGTICRMCPATLAYTDPRLTKVKIQNLKMKNGQILNPPLREGPKYRLKEQCIITKYLVPKQQLRLYGISHVKIHFRTRTVLSLLYQTIVSKINAFSVPIKKY